MEIESMKGVVLGYEIETETIVLRADSGRRYRFQVTDWRDRGSPRKGDSVDFEPDGDRARDVYRVAPSRLVETDALAAPVSVVADWAPARFFMARPVFSFALLILLACLVGAYAVGDLRISLFQVPELIGHMSESLDSLIAISGADPLPRLAAGFARVLLILLLGLYAVPVLAAFTAWREFVGRPDRRLARYAGIAAMVLPVGLPLLVAFVVQVWVLPGIPDAGARLGRSGVTTPQQVFEVLKLYATGSVLLFFTGLGLWASAAGRFSVPIGQRTIDEPVLETRRPKESSGAFAFIPFRKRGASPKAATPKQAPPKQAPPKQAPPKLARPAQAAPAQTPPKPSPPMPSPPMPSPPAQTPRVQTPPAQTPRAQTQPAAIPPAPPAPPAPQVQTPSAPDPQASPAVSLLRAGLRARAGKTETGVPGTVVPEISTPEDDARTAALGDDIKSALEADIPQAKRPSPPRPAPELPPRGGSVWPEPAAAQFRQSPQEAGDEADTAPNAASDQDGTTGHKP
ncbi:hypothetical protein [Microbaculum sp. FT89]|uniref:hypothetical protein n=1 Tax=Microbaculum sp. FT89 TaxID=3447298 RepID=UPI003F52D84B